MDCNVRPEAAHGLEPEMASGPERALHKNERRERFRRGPLAFLHPPLSGNIISIFIFAQATYPHFALLAKT